MASKLPQKIGDAGLCIVRRKQKKKKKKNGDRDDDDAAQMLALRVRRGHVRKLQAECCEGWEGCVQARVQARVHY